MKVIGIIAEYNPFHNGHLYHLRTAKEITGADAVVVVMSGDFVQRGEPAVVDKIRRTEAALAGGADAVLELPVSWATGTAERFAMGAVSILERLNVVSEIVCGSETPEPELAEKILDCMESSSPEYASIQEQIQSRMDRGMTWPAARAAVLEEFVPGSAAYLSSPNNTLSLEYRKAIRRIPGCSLKLREIERIGQGYNDDTPADADNMGFPSATSLRRILIQNRRAEGTISSDAQEALLPYMPDASRESLEYAISPDDLSQLLYYAVMSHSTDELAADQDMNRDLANRLKELFSVHPEYTWSEAAEALKTRNITRTRANRALLHTVLGLREPIRDPAGGSLSIPAAGTLSASAGSLSIPAAGSLSVPTADSILIPAAVHLLGFRRNTPLMRQIMNNTQIPVITKMADAPAGAFEDDIRSTRLYNRLVSDLTHGNLQLKDDYRQSPIIY